MAKAFASQGDLTEKKISFTEIGRDLWAFTAEGDPNTGVVIGDDSVMIVDAQATPRLAAKVVEKIRGVTDKPIKYVVLSHYHAVRVLGAAAYDASEIIASETCRGMIHERGQEDWDSEFGRFPRLFGGSREHSRPDLAQHDLQRADDHPHGQAPGRADATRPGPYRRRYRRLGAPTRRSC